MPAVRRGVARVALTDVEKALLPVGGMVTHEVKYTLGQLGIADVKKVSGLTANGQTVRAGGNRDATPVYLPPALVDYAPFLTQLRESASMMPWTFPTLWKENQQLLEASLKNSVARVEAVENNSQLFYASLRSEVFQGTVPYYRFLPSKAVDYIYVGEVHENPLVHEELINFLGQVKRRYPQRNVYLATEYVWESQQISTLKEKLPLAIARNKEELFQLLQEDYTNFQFLHQAIEMKIPVVGLEPFLAILQEARSKGTADVVQDYSRNRRKLSLSELGMQLRNERWAEHIRQIRQEDPNALVVVHGGAQHTSLHNLVSVSNKLKGSSFSLMILDWRVKDTTNPVVARLDDQQFMWRKFEENPEAKYVLSLKEPAPSFGRTLKDLKAFRRALGADMILFLKDLSPMIIP